MSHLSNKRSLSSNSPDGHLAAEFTYLWQGNLEDDATTSKSPKRTQSENIRPKEEVQMFEVIQKQNRTLTAELDETRRQLKTTKSEQRQEIGNLNAQVDAKASELNQLMRKLDNVKEDSNELKVEINRAIQERDAASDARDSYANKLEEIRKAALLRENILLERIKQNEGKAAHDFSLQKEKEIRKDYEAKDLLERVEAMEELYEQSNTTVQSLEEENKSLESTLNKLKKDHNKKGEVEKLLKNENQSLLQQLKELQERKDNDTKTVNTLSNEVRLAKELNEKSERNAASLHNKLVTLNTQHKGEVDDFLKQRKTLKAKEQTNEDSILSLEKEIESIKRENERKLKEVQNQANAIEAELGKNKQICENLKKEVELFKNDSMSLKNEHKHCSKKQHTLQKKVDELKATNKTSEKSWKEEQEQFVARARASEHKYFSLEKEKGNLLSEAEQITRRISFLDRTINEKQKLIDKGECDLQIVENENRKIKKECAESLDKSRRKIQAENENALQREKDLLSKISGVKYQLEAAKNASSVHLEEISKQSNAIAQHQEEYTELLSRTIELTALEKEQKKRLSEMEIDRSDAERIYAEEKLVLVKRLEQKEQALELNVKEVELIKRDLCVAKSQLEEKLLGIKSLEKDKKVYLQKEVALSQQIQSERSEKEKHAKEIEVQLLKLVQSENTIESITEERELVIKQAENNCKEREKLIQELRDVIHNHENRIELSGRMLVEKETEFVTYQVTTQAHIDELTVELSINKEALTREKDRFIRDNNSWRKRFDDLEMDMDEKEAKLKKVVSRLREELGQNTHLTRDLESQADSLHLQLENKKNEADRLRVEMSRWKDGLISFSKKGETTNVIGAKFVTRDNSYIVKSSIGGTMPALTESQFMSKKSANAKKPLLQSIKRGTSSGGSKTKERDQVPRQASQNTNNAVLYEKSESGLDQMSQTFPATRRPQKKTGTSFSKDVADIDDIFRDTFSETANWPAIENQDVDRISRRKHLTQASPHKGRKNDGEAENMIGRAEKFLKQRRHHNLSNAGKAALGLQ